MSFFLWNSSHAKKFELLELLLLFELVFLSEFMDTTAYYVDFIWFFSPWHWGYSIRWWLSYLCSQDCRESQVTGCYCSIFQDVFAFFSSPTFLFPSWATKPCFPFWKLYFHSQFYVRLKAGALEGYQLINKLQSSHLVINLFHWSKWKFRPLAFKWQFQKGLKNVLVESIAPIFLRVLRGSYYRVYEVCLMYT